MKPCKPLMQRPIRSVVAALALAAPAAAADYDRLKLFELVALADAVVAGQIVEVRDDAYDLRVERWIVGRGPGGVRIERFEDWTCAGRWAPYETGQRVLLFLERTDEPGPWRALGAGNEGDMALLAGGAVAPRYRVRGYEGGIADTRVPADELIGATLGFREAFWWEPGGVREEQIARIEPRASVAEARAFAATSRTARHLFEEAWSSNAWPHEPVATEQVAGSLPRVELAEHELRAPAGALAFLGGDTLALGPPGDGSSAVALLALDAAGAVESVGAIETSSLASAQRRAAFGSTLARLGDLDGDGADDVLVGAVGWNAAVPGSGGAWVAFLDAERRVVRASELTQAPALLRAAGVEIDGPRPHPLGKAATALGDLDGDGTLEVAIAQQWTLMGGRDDVLVVVASLGRRGDVTKASAIAGSGFGFGEALASPGDVDGDGVADLAIGDLGQRDGGMLRGAVWIVFLRADGTERERRLVSDWEGGFEGLLFDGASFGRALAAPGDVDGDGVPDLLAGSDQGLWLLFLTRAGTVREHRQIRDARHGFTDVGSLGRSIACAPERESDGSLRLAVGGRSGKRDVLWLLRLRRDGTVLPW